MTRRGLSLLSQTAVRRYLLETLGIDPKRLAGLDPGKLALIWRGYGSRKVWELRRFVRLRPAGGEALLNEAVSRILAGYGNPPGR